MIKDKPKKPGVINIRRVQCNQSNTFLFCFDVADNKSTIWVREFFSYFKAKGVIKQNGNPTLAAILPTKNCPISPFSGPHGICAFRTMSFLQHVD